MKWATKCIVLRSAAIAALAGILGLPSARADIGGFNAGCDWQVNGNGNVPFFSADGTGVTLTDDMNSEGVSLFYLEPQSVSAFTAQFTWQMSGGFDANGNLNPADGFAFVIQIDPRGPNAVDGSGGCLAWCGINPSIAVAFNVYGFHVRGSNLFMNGNLTFDSTGLHPVYMDSTPVMLTSGDPIQVNLTYDGSTLTETLLDTATCDTITFTYPIDILGDLGFCFGYVGFTAGTGGLACAQSITNFSYTYTGP